MAEISPLRRRMIEDMQSVAGDATILPCRGIEVEPVFWSIPDCLELEDIRAFQVHLVASGYPGQR